MNDKQQAYTDLKNMFSAEAIVFLSLPYFGIFFAILCVCKEKVYALLGLGVLWTVFSAIVLYYIPILMRAIDKSNACKATKTSDTINAK